MSRAVGISLRQTWGGSEETKLAYQWAHQKAKRLAASSGNMKAIIGAGKANFAAGVERIAQSDRVFAVTSEIWDTDPWLLGTPGGTVDLRTGKIRPAAREDYITKQAAVTPADIADCPKWLQFLNEACQEDPGMLRFLQQWGGYCLTGATSEHALIFIYGPGGNGKSVFLNVMAGVIGDYAAVAALDTFVASVNDRHPTDLAKLRGARLVSVSETEEGRAWAESRIKQLTGGDKISARFMHRDFFEYLPQFKPNIIGNHKPVLRNVDDASRRRFNIVPFTNKPATVDKQLEAKLQAERPGILRWFINGCLDWQENGLLRPEVVLTTTNSYFEEQDIVRQWIDECCEVGPRHADMLAVLFKDWSNYAVANGEKPGTSKWFSQTLVKLDYEPVKNTPGLHGRRGFKGISTKLTVADREYNY